MKNRYEIIIQEYQRDLEDALFLEINPEECKKDKYGKKLLTYLKRRRRITTLITKILNWYSAK